MVERADAALEVPLRVSGDETGCCGRGMLRRAVHLFPRAGHERAQERDGLGVHAGGAHGRAIAAHQAPGPHDSFVAQLGGLVCRDCAPMGAARVDAETVSLLRALMSGTWDEVDGASEHATAAASGLVAAYTQWHLERGIRSLDHVEYLPWVAR